MQNTKTKYGRQDKEYRIQKQKNAINTTHTKTTAKTKHRPSPEEQLVVFRIEDPRIPFVPRRRQQGDNCLKLEGKMVIF